MAKEIKKIPVPDSDDEFKARARLDKSQIARRLKEVIAAAGGNKKIASRTGIPLSTINNYTTGESEPKLSAAALISAACNVSLAWLAYGEGPKVQHHARTAAGAETKPLTQITLTVYDSIYESGKLVTPATFGSLLASYYNLYKEMDCISYNEVDGASNKEMDGVQNFPPDEAKWLRLKELLAVALKASRE